MAPGFYGLASVRRETPPPVAPHPVITGIRRKADVPGDLVGELGGGTHTRHVTTYR